MFKPISREEYHKLKWKKVYWKDDCPFCDVDSNISRLLRKWKHWYILYNIASYSWDDRHIMAIPYEHIKYSVNLTDEHLNELKDIYKVVKDFFKDEEYFSFTRESMWSRSAEHLHIHFLVWKLQWKFLRKMLEMQGYPIKQDLKIN